MSTSGIGSSSSVPGFDVLFPNGVPGTNATYATTSPANANYATIPATSTSSTAPSSSSSTTPTASNSGSTTTSSTGLNVYQQAYAGIEQWQDTVLAESVEGDPPALGLPTDGESVSSFAQLATELGQLNIEQSTGTSQLGSTIDTSA